jgi:hypothetical protein
VSLLRAISSVALVIALGFALTKTSSSAVVAPVEAPCAAPALSTPFTGPEKVSAVANYGCEGGWAFLWATIGKGPTAVGVTEVLRYDQAAQQWRVALRQHVCHATILPHLVYERGCFSN